MQQVRYLGGSRRYTRRLVVSSFVLVSLAGTALAFQGSASSAVSRVSAREHAVTGLSRRIAARWPKLDSRLDSLVTRSAPTAAARGGLVQLGVPLQAGKVQVRIEAANLNAARAAVRRLSGTVEATWHDYVKALVPRGALVPLSRQSSVRYVGALEQIHEEAVNGEEVAASLANSWQAKGITGQGVKVAIIDGGFAGLAERQASGDIPASVTKVDLCGGRFSTATAHGTAVTEVVHEMAPGAVLYLACTTDEFSVAAAEQWAKTQGATVINMSAGFFLSGRGDGSGIVGSAAADARANGILWVNAAGNHAQGHWTGNFVDTNGDKYLDFAPGDEGNTFIWHNNEVICGYLKWDEWPNGSSDFDLALILSSNFQTIAASTIVQNGSTPPIEGVCAVNGSGSDQTVAWVIYGSRVVSNPRLDLFSTADPLQYFVPAGSIIDPAANAAALAAGAICWQTNSLEFYSSQGPTIDGRPKPDLAAQDSVSSATYGPFDGSCPSGFAGTSAASPTVAGAAALVKQVNPSFGPDQIEAYLQRNAVDFGPSGFDTQYGAGGLHLPATTGIVDRTRPTARALGSSGLRGHLVKLYSRLFDNSGQLKLREQVKRNGHVIKTYNTGYLSTPKAETGYLSWPAPLHIRGIVTHCTRAQDRAGNVSAISCARVTLRG
jgi:subtilisin family serine protease